jgi:DNA-binding transcriptional MerR regulator
LFPAGLMTSSGANGQQVPEIPDKLYFRIGEVSRLIGVRPYVLRYWESEFPALSPRKSRAGQRLYRRKEVELLLEIKHLLYDKRYTIEGARQYLATHAKNGRRERPAPSGQGELFSAPSPALSEIRDGLAAILDLLK